MSARRSRTLGVAGLAFVLLTAVVGLWWAPWRTDPTVPAASAAIPTTTTTTTTSIPPADALTHTIATASVPLVVALAELPPDVANEPSVPLSDRAAWPAYSTGPKMGEIPSLTQGVAGRFRTANGWEFATPNAFGNPAVFLVTERRGDWLRVLLPVRPAGTQGWVHAADVVLSTTHFRVEVNVGTRELRVFDGATAVLEAAVVVGIDRTPTPTGRYYATDHLPPHGAAYGSGILATSGFSQALDLFSDGVPVIALHGTNRPDLLGTAASNGCIRMDEPTVAFLRDRIPVGTPVDITP
jgi:lipoprotein-anchoring transpeptidase ErfK/SrfK